MQRPKSTKKERLVSEKQVPEKQVKFGMMGRSFAPMDRALETIRKAEAQGWDFIDFADQIQSTHPLGMLPHPTPAGHDDTLVSAYGEHWFGSFEMMAAAAVLTSDIEVHIGVVDPLRRSPAVFAQEAVTISHMAKGRSAWCVASGEAKQFEPYGEKRTKPNARLDEAIRTMNALWASEGKPVSRESEFWPLTDATFPLPLYENRKPRIYAVGGTESLVDLAGELCDGWMTALPPGTGGDLDRLAGMISGVKSAAVKYDRDPAALDFNAMVLCCLAETDEKAWELARHPVSAWMTIAAASIDSAATWAKLGFENPLGGDYNWSKDLRVTMLSGDAASRLADSVPEEMTDLAWVWGNPERVAAKVQKYIDAGHNYISFVNYAAMVEPEYGAKWTELISDVIVRLGGKPLRLDV